ncbi:uncharacterized protein LOC117653723 [Thrips palmi]|uniref:Uncharacterized protein LOC117653723 n=1 Tax=Thrips palmi TaxID=161013 RepID=A0A6P9ABH6_THRPL|nr:uncharacterized protein LOC117653723 [Thrips palmi]
MAASNDNTDWMNNSLNASLNISIASSVLQSSTPFKVPAKPRTRGKTGAKRVYVRAVCDTCNVCGKEYRCHRSYLNHMRQHSIKEAASRFPSASKMIQHCTETISESFEAMKLRPAFGPLGQQYKAVVQNAKDIANGSLNIPQWNELFKIIHEEATKDVGECKVLLPSALISVLMKNCDRQLSDRCHRKKLCDLLQMCIACSTSVANIFIADYILMLVTKMFKYYSSCLKKDVTDQRVEVVELDNEDKETIHFISGAVVRAFYKKSRAFAKSNVRWAKIGNLITNKLLESDVVPGPPAIVKGWTIAKNKGRLFFVSGALFDFFVGIAETLEKTIDKKFRVDSNRVIEAVCQGTVILLWDEAVGDCVNEALSYDLMCGMTRSFCNTFGVGLAKKLLNKRRKAEASLPLRAQVAPRRRK